MPVLKAVFAVINIISMGMTVYNAAGVVMEHGGWMFEKASQIVKRTETHYETFDNGLGVFVSFVDDGILYAASMHPSKWHSATALVNGKMIKRTGGKVEAPPGYWAISKVEHGKMGGNMAYYDFW